MASAAQTALRNLLHAAEADVDVAINAFNDPNVSDADVLTAMQNAGAALTAKSSQVPTFLGPIGQFFAGKSVTSLSDGGASLSGCSIVGPGQFQFTGLSTDVGPFTMQNRCEAIISAMLNWTTQITTEEGGGTASGTPTGLSQGSQVTIAIY